AIMCGWDSSMASTSARTISIFGWFSSRDVISAAKRLRSTARASPAGTLAGVGGWMMGGPRRRNSSLSRAAALVIWFDLSEFEQTSSAKLPVWWTGVLTTGRISQRRTFAPDWAACQAASLPARPPPMIVMTGSIWESVYPVGRREEIAWMWR